MLQLTIFDRLRVTTAAYNQAAEPCSPKTTAHHTQLLRAHIAQRSTAGPVALRSRQPTHAPVSSRNAWPAPKLTSPSRTTTRKSAAAGGSAVGGSSSAAVPERLQAVLDGLDTLNARDPRTVEVDGQVVPYELAYARWLTAWMERLCADAGRGPSEELRIAARGQHVERWKVPRTSYPEGRAAYLQWREDLKRQHAATTTGLMAAAGYPPESCKRVEQLILKRALKEAEGQILEDALCLVFLERQFAEFLPRLAELAGGDLAEAEAKMVDILQKSWKKMGELGRAAALTIPLEPRLAELVGRALAPPQPQPTP